MIPAAEAGAGSSDGGRSLARAAAALKTDEGFVVAFEHSGHRVKMKADAYLRLHRGRSMYESETHVVRACAEGDAEQLCDVLDPERAAKVAEFAERLEQAIRETATRTAETAETIQRTEPKTARASQSRGPPIAARPEPNPSRCSGSPRSLPWNAGENAMAAVSTMIKSHIAKNARSGPRIKSGVLPLIGGASAPRWQPSKGGLNEAG